VIDSRGGSGNIAHNAERQHDDLYTCLAIAEDNTNDLLEATKKGYNWLVRPRTLWLMPELTDKKKLIVENCVECKEACKQDFINEKSVCRNCDNAFCELGERDV
jgi:hypothetical protein